MSGDDLVEFLRDRLDEDERITGVFRNDLGSVSEWCCDEIGGKIRKVGPMPFGLPDVIAQAELHMIAAHMARHDPARVLAEVAAKRRLLDEHADYGEGLGQTPDGDYGMIPAACTTCGTPSEYAVAWPCPTLRTLALSYAGHPDYRQEWRP